MEVRNAYRLAIIGIIVLAQACIVESSDGDGDDDGDGNGTRRSCSTLCNAAQLGDCTWVDGDCDAFCGALERAAPKGGCDDERDAYHECVDGRDDICDGGCNALESDLESCMATYCYANQGDADCAVLVGSY